MDFIQEISNTINNTNNIKDRYIKNYPNKKYELKEIISEIIYVLKSGVSWNMARTTVKPKTLYWHYSELVKHNIFERTFNKIKSKYLKLSNQTNSYVLIDTSTIYNRNGINKIGRNKFYKNKNSTKISLATDVNGIPLSVFFMKGNYHDNRVFDNHIKDIIRIKKIKNTKILADKGYSAKKNYKLLDDNKIKHIIPPRSNMKMYKTYKYDKTEYKKRIKVENTFAIIKNNKRNVLRMDKLVRNFAGFVYLSIIVRISNKINNMANSCKD